MIDHITPILDKYFWYDKIFDLLDYDEDLQSLYEELKQLSKPHYENNYRFIFLHYDTDYYITNDQPGVLLRNLQRMIWSLGIGNYFCLILSQQNLENELDRLRIEETTEDVSIACITHPLQNINYFPQLVENLNSDKIVKNYSCFNRQKRFHRLAMFVLLKENNLLDKGMVSFGAKQS
jgi:hypothetical protein